MILRKQEKALYYRLMNGEWAGYQQNEQSEGQLKAADCPFVAGVSVAVTLFSHQNCHGMVWRKYRASTSSILQKQVRSKSTAGHSLQEISVHAFTVAPYSLYSWFPMHQSRVKVSPCNRSFCSPCVHLYRHPKAVVAVVFHAK